MPIRVRLTLLALLGAVVLTTAGGWIFVHQLRHGLHASLDSALRTRADALVQTLQDASAGINFQDSGSTQLLDAKEAIAQVATPQGRVAESSEASGTRLLVTPAQFRAAQTRSIFLDGHLPGDDHGARLLATPIVRPDGRWVVVVGSSLEAADEAVARVRSALLVGGAFTLLVATGGAWLLGGLALRPVERMRRRAAAISEHDIESRLPVPATRDEIAELGQTMNALLERLQLALVRQRAFVADASHELRTPLAILRTELELAAQPGRDATELRAAITRAGSETQRLSQLADELLFLAKCDEPETTQSRELQPLHPLLERAADGARTQATPLHVEISLDAPRDLTVTVNGDDLRRAVDNLLANAVRHAPPGTTVELSAEESETQLTIAVRDRGAGFPPEFLPHAFERFRRADAARARDDGGSGLGLAIVRTVARSHGGDAEAGNRAGGGAEVVLRLPRIREQDGRRPHMSRRT